MLATLTNHWDGEQPRKLLRAFHRASQAEGPSRQYPNGQTPADRAASSHASQDRGSALPAALSALRVYRFPPMSKHGPPDFSKPLK